MNNSSIDFFLKKIKNNDFNFKISDFLAFVNKKNIDIYSKYLQKIMNYLLGLVNDFINFKFDSIPGENLFFQYLEITDNISLIKKLDSNILSTNFDFFKFIKKRIQFIRKKLKIWEYKYYALEKPEVSDTIYDLVLKELNFIEQKFPNLAIKSSPTSKLGGAISNKFQKVEHKFPMLSLSNAFNIDDLKKFDASIKKKTSSIKNISYVVEPKIDGLSISLIYKNGLLVQGLTRGDGKFGEDVTKNILMVDSIPKKIKYCGKYLEVRGEIFLDFKQFELINLSIKDEKDKFANPRNAASGTIRRLNTNLVKERKLQFIGYHIPDFSSIKELKISKQSEVLLKLKSFGFRVHDNVYHCNSIDDAYKDVVKLEQNQNGLLYPIDGAVVKVDEISLYDKLGYTSKFPHWAIAYKFVPEEAKTKLLSISTSVGRTGKITYVANLKPIELSGSRISSATLNNANYIKTKDIRVGDIVIVYKAAEIIPYIKESVKEDRGQNIKPFVAPDHCPICNSKLEKKNDSDVDQYCVNTSCPARVLNSIIHYCSKDAMDIQGLSEKTIAKYFKLGYLKNIQDIYKLNDKRVDIIENVFNKKFKTFNNVIYFINLSKTKSLEKLLYALGILNVGSVLAEKLARHYKNIDNLMSASIDELIQLKDIGLTVSKSIYEWFHNSENIKLINELKIAGVNMTFLERNISLANKQSEFYKKNICITGSFEIPRDQIKSKLIEKYDANILDSVSKSLDYLIVGSNGGSKIEKAKKIGIKLIYNKIWEN